MCHRLMTVLLTLLLCQMHPIVLHALPMCLMHLFVLCII